MPPYGYLIAEFPYYITKVLIFHLFWTVIKGMKSLLEEFREYARRAGIAQNSYIVGGTVRDFLLGEKTKDVDIALSINLPREARDFARSTGASFVTLDEEFNTYRVVRGDEHIDFSLLRGKTIEDDLRDRDITINALAMPLLSRRKIIDPLGGANDLLRGRIRAVSEKNLKDDPLRVLRVYRFSALPGFRIEKKTGTMLKKLSPLLKKPAPERITEEMRHILLRPNSRRTLERMFRDSALRAIIPRFRRRNLSALRVFEGEWRRFPHHKELGGRVDVFSLKLSLLLRGAGERGTERLVLSNKEKELIKRIFYYESFLRRVYKRKAIKLTLVKILRDTGDEIFTHLIAAYSVLRSANNHRANGFMEFSRELLKIYLKEAKPRIGKRLITGDDLIELGMKPGPEMGRILERAELLWLSGRIKTREKLLTVYLKNRINVVKR
jgi:tRNA nucleotidyltransferase (CCA-adding enzyme)